MGLVNMTAFFIIIVIVAIAIVGAAVLMIGYVIYWYLRNYLQPTTRIKAMVIRKRHKQWDVSIIGETPEMEAARLGTLGRDSKTAAKAYTKLAGMQDLPEITLADGTDCFVTFAYKGSEVEFTVPMKVYISVDKGTEGLLVFQGEKFRHFITGV